MRTCGSRRALALLLLLALCVAAFDGSGLRTGVKMGTVYAAVDSDSAYEEDALLAAYHAYEERFAEIERAEDIVNMGYTVVEKHVFDVPLVTTMPSPDSEELIPAEVVRPESMYEVGEEDPVATQIVPTVRFYCAIENDCHRAAVFLTDAEGNIIYKTNQLECNYTITGKLEQPIYDMVSVAFQDLNNDGLMDIILIAGCVNDTGAYAYKPYKVGEVLFQTGMEADTVSFYRDWRINDKLNRFDMNKSAKCIRSFVRDGRSTEFLYTATTEDELLANGFVVTNEQSAWRTFEKLGKLKVLPGTFSIADYDIFMIYLINEQGDIVWSFQPMGDYDNLYSLRSVRVSDLDGDGMKDLLVVARYSKEGDNGEMIVMGQYSIYYQRTGGFDTDVDFAVNHPYLDNYTVDALAREIQAYWGWATLEVVAND